MSMDREDSPGGDAQADLDFLTALETRVRDLEDERQRLAGRSRMLSLGLLLALAGLGAVGYQTFMGTDGGSDVVDASAIQLRGPDGLIRAELRATDEGAVRFALSDRAGTQRLRFSVQPDGSPGVALQDAAGNNRVVLALLADETGTLVFADKQGATRAVFGLSPDEQANLIFSDPAGTPSVALGVDGAGRSSVMLPSFEDPSDGSSSDPGGAP